MDHGWNVGAVISFPLFSGFLTKYQVEEAKGEPESSSRRMKSH